jgi:uncharacterized protein with GYD domain
MLFALMADYTPEAMKALIRDPVDRGQVLSRMLEATRVKVVDFYATSGGDNEGVLVLYNVQEEIDFKATLNIAIASGAFRSVRGIRLLTGEESRQALVQAKEFQNHYQPPH